MNDLEQCRSYNCTFRDYVSYHWTWISVHIGLEDQSEDADWREQKLHALSYENPDIFQDVQVLK